MSETWGGYDRNVHDNPEKCGLKLVGQLEDVGACYSFDTIIVLQDEKTGKLYVAHDSGCSCPSPFEDVRGLGDLTEIRAITDLTAFVGAHEDSYSDKWPFADRSSLYRKVKAALKSAPEPLERVAYRVVGAIDRALTRKDDGSIRGFGEDDLTRLRDSLKKALAA